ncbi:MAG: hypothetical protein SH857_05555 [Chitinophagales bacterium]|nr:hypothetical protein [Chitinophagales bacterium]
MKIHRLNSLKAQYKKVKDESLKFMQSGDLKNYLRNLTKATKIQNEYIETLHMQV